MWLRVKDLEDGSELSSQEVVQVALQILFQVTCSLHLFHLITFGLKEATCLEIVDFMELGNDGWRVFIQLF